MEALFQTTVRRRRRLGGSTGVEAPRGPETGRSSADEARGPQQEHEKMEEARTPSFIEDFRDPA